MHPNSLQRKRIALLLLFAALLMQLMSLSHALHGPFSLDSAPTSELSAERAHADGHCDSPEHAHHHPPDHDAIMTLMECECLLCKMVKAPALMPTLSIATVHTAAPVLRPTTIRFVPEHLFPYRPPSRAPPA